MYMSLYNLQKIDIERLNFLKILLYFVIFSLIIFPVYFSRKFIFAYVVVLNLELCV